MPQTAASIMRPTTPIAIPMMRPVCAPATVAVDVLEDAEDVPLGKEPAPAPVLAAADPPVPVAAAVTTVFWPVVG